MNKNIQEIINNNLSNRIDWDDYFISTALLISCRSPCHRLHVGCILVKNNRIISSGYNGYLPGSNHLSIVVINNNSSHEQATVHAECNAIADCANRGVDTNNAIAYITHYPCINCFKILVASGIKEIKYLHDYKNDKNIEILLNNMTNKIIINKIDL
jgi:dCMP deaminase|uniref:CMP/dCMP-type deaminase domain-containing protein n=1 Tax=viral metagenome TaxID=1070528 RepID=A0A6C0HVY8_9ZZZZ